MDSSFKFGKRSLKQLEGVNEALQALCHETIKRSYVDFGILQGLRSVEQQKKNVVAGVSQTMRSRHLTGHAIDFGIFVNGAYINGDTVDECELYKQVGEIFKVTSHIMGVPIVWGGDWKTLKDYGHIELDRKAYP